MENKILTMDDYMKRGGMGLNICILCCGMEKTILHLMIMNPFTQVVWLELKKVYQFNQDWHPTNVHLCFQQGINNADC